jgi:hypothetical protein
MYKRLIATAAVLIACTPFIVPASMVSAGPPPQADAYVSTTGTDVGTCLDSAPCATINYAIGQAPAGGTVSVAHGVYHQTVSITKPINVIGAGANNTTIDGSADISALAVVDVQTLSPPGGPVQVSGFTITNPVCVGPPSTCEPYAVVLRDKNFTSDTVTISDNIITEGSADSNRSTDFPVGIWTYHNARSGQTMISDNTIDGFFQGALLEDSGPVAFADNTVKNLISGTDTSTSPATVYPPEGLFFLSDDGASYSSQNATGNAFQDYAGYGIKASAGYAGKATGSLKGALTSNSFKLQGAIGAAAISLSSQNPGSDLVMAVDENRGSTTSPSDSIDISATSGGATSITEQNNDIRVQPGKGN